MLRTVEVWLACGLAAGLAACGDDGGVPDAGARDAGTDSGTDGGMDGGGVVEDAGFEWPDSGPAPTGCGLLDGAVRADGGVDAGVLAPNGYPPITGPGGPAVTFDESELLVACAHLDGGDRDRDHHNTVLMLDGYLYMPWAHEGGVGGISVFEIDEPCAPVHVGTTVEEQMRETHAAGVTWSGGRFMVTTSLTGILFWDVSDPAAPRLLTNFTLPGVTYPDSYARVVLSLSWQAPYVYVGAADNGVFIVDASDPSAPELVGIYEPLPELRVGNVFAIGTLLVVQGTEAFRTNLVDIGDPAHPRPIPGGTLQVTDGTFDRFGRPRLRPFYFGHVNGDRAYYARNTLGGGLVVFDISDETAPTFLGNWDAPPIANGGYVFLKEDVAFVGLSEYAAAVDVSDMSSMTMSARFDMQGDVDTAVPMGNVVVVSVDDDAVPGEASSIFPFATEPDRRAPRVNMVVPREGATRVPLSARVGITLDEPVELATVWRGSFRVQKVGSDVPLEGRYSGQEGILNFWPAEPLEPSSTYEVIVPAGGVTDVSGNAVAVVHRSTFTTVDCE